MNHRKVSTDDKAGLTLGQLRAFLDQAAQSGVPDTARVRGRVKFSGFLHEVSANTRDDRPGGQG